MKRDLSQLINTEYDILIIGGGVYGLFTAWDAALRGLRVALLEKNDFGHATSFNSLRVIHGGLRYLQHGHVKRMRQSIRERSIFMRIAPHVVHPLPFIFPTYGHGIRGKEVFSLALRINDLIGFDRNRLIDPQKNLPNGRVVSKEECQRLVPGISSEGLTGGAICYDAQLSNSERLLIAIAQSASQAGAALANYAEVTGGIERKDRLIGVEAQDVLSGEKLEIRSKLIINASGPWVNQVLQRVHQPHVSKITAFTKAFNILIRRQLIPHYAVGIYSKQKYTDTKAIINKGTRLYIITPWREFSLIGTAHLPVQGEPSTVETTNDEIQAFLSEINHAYPAAQLSPQEIAWTYWGFLPSPESTGEAVQLAKHYQICDHEKRDGTAGLLSVVGVKFTESRYVAEQTVDMAFKKLGQHPPPSQTAQTPVFGGDVSDLSSYIKDESQRLSNQSFSEAVPSLIGRYGSRYQQVLDLLPQDIKRGNRSDPCEQVIRAEVLHGIREEGAQTFADVVFRRIGWNHPDVLHEGHLEGCVSVMAEELGWSDMKAKEELLDVQLKYQARLMKIS